MNILDLKRKLMPLSGYMGGGSPASSSTTSTTGLPEWAKGYAQDTLAKQAALSDRPYEAYGANRIQGFTPMQEQARQNASNMNAGPEGFSQGIGAYMSPYQQQVTDIQKRKAGQAFDIMGQQQQAQAAQKGAFGGSRAVLERSLLDQQRQQQMADIQAAGDQANFGQASSQFRQGITQGMDVNRLQSAYGAQEQAMGQRGLDQAYQDYQNQREYPQQQLGNMANMMRGLPIGSTTTGTGYQNPGSPSFGQMLGSAGTAAWGLKQFFADGGSVDSQQNIESIVSKLLDPALDQAEEAAKARGDQVQLEAIQTEKAARASMRQGLASLPVDMDKMLPTEQSMARGGIVAFAGGGMDKFGYNPNASFSSDTGANAVVEELEPELDEEGMRKGLLRKLYKDYQTPAPAYTEQTPEQRLAAVMAARKELADAAGPSQYDEERANIKRIQEENATNKKRNMGLAAFEAAGAMLGGNDLARGIGAGLGAFGKAYGPANQASQAEERALQNMRFNLADAERKEKMGPHREAQGLVAAAEQNRRAAHAARQEENYRQRTNMQGILAATKPPKEAAEAKLPEAALAAVTAYRLNPTPENKIKANAAMEVLSASRTTDIGPTRQGVETTRLTDAAGVAATRTNASINALVEKGKLLDPAFQEALSKGDSVGMEAAKNAMYDAIAKRQGVASAKPAAAAGAGTPRIENIEGAPPGAKLGKLVPGKGHEVLDSSGKLIGYAQ
jgi:hypothetical protein